MNSILAMGENLQQLRHEKPRSDRSRYTRAVTVPPRYKIPAPGQVQGSIGIPGDSQTPKSAGMDGYITKPIRPQELDDVLEEQLRKRSAMGDLPAKAEQFT